jgi:voltage-gated potassium channel Kch
MMNLLAVGGGLLVILLILFDAFETIILPRRVTRRFRLARLFVRYSWQIWHAVARRLPSRMDREGASVRDRFLGIYGPLALILLLAVWAVGLVLSFALLLWGLHPTLTSPGGGAGFGTFLYLSGVTFFTLGYGDVVPLTGTGRLAAVTEVATGFSFLALIIGYLPVVYQAFSRRETNITLLDARAGSPPSAVELLRRYAQFNDTVALEQFLHEWERWSAEILESHLSYPVLPFFRSQHDHLSWLAALTVILDTCTLLMVGVENGAGRIPSRQARLTFAMARHVVGDLAQILYAAPRPPREERLPPAAMLQLRDLLAAAGLQVRAGEEAEQWLAELRRLYEPYVATLADRLLFALPSWLPSEASDDWQTTAWDWDPAVLPPVDTAEVI